MSEKIEQKPFILEIEEAKMEMVQAINNIMKIHKLPCYITEMILENVHSQIREGARGELEMAKVRIDNTDVKEG